MRRHFLAYPKERYLRTARVQITARLYGESFHAGGVAKELRNMMLGARTPEEHIAGVEWLYGKQAELTRGSAAAAPAMAS